MLGFFRFLLLTLIFNIISLLSIKVFAATGCPDVSYVFRGFVVEYESQKILEDVDVSFFLDGRSVGSAIAQTDDKGRFAALGKATSWVGTALFGDSCKLATDITLFINKDGFWPYRKTIPLAKTKLKSLPQKGIVLVDLEKIVLVPQDAAAEARLLLEGESK